MALTERQKRRGRETLARKRGVAQANISDADLDVAISDGSLSSADCGGDYSGISGVTAANYSYNNAADSPSYSSSDSGGSSGGDSGCG